MPSLAGCVSWVTGASSGIGRALAVALAREGATVVLSARNREALDTARRACPHPERHHVLPLDLADPASLPGHAEAVLRQAGRIDLLVNNAGLSQRGLAADTPLAVDRRIFEVNYFGTVALTKAVLPSMRARGTGRIVTVTSLVGLFGTPLRSSYAASKHALHGFMDSLRAEVFAEGIRVTLACPGFVRTDISRHALTADGSPQGTLDRGQARGMDPDRCAARIVRAIAAGRDEVYIGGRERWAVPLHRFAPGLFRRLVRRVRVT